MVVVGGGAACVVIVAVVAGGGGVVAVCVVAAAGLECACGLCFAGGFLAAVVVVEVVEVVGVVWVVLVVAGALALWVVVDEAAPQALTNSASRTAAAGMRISFMTISLNPPGFLTCPLRTPWGAGCFPSHSLGSEQPVNAPPAQSIRRGGAATIRSWRTMSGARCSWSTMSPRSPRSSPAI